jgi:hypothetical protein
MKQLLNDAILSLHDVSFWALELSRQFGETRPEDVTVLIAARVLVAAAEMQDRLQRLQDDVAAAQIGEPAE